MAEELEAQRTDYEKQLDEWDTALYETREETRSELAIAFAENDQAEKRHASEMEESFIDDNASEKEKESLRSDLATVRNQLQKREALIALGKAQLERMKTQVAEANVEAAAARKECEEMTTKNSQLTRELFLARRVGSWRGVDA